MSVLDHQVCPRRHHVAHDPFVERMIPDSRRRHDDAVGTQRLCQFLEMFRVAADYFATGLLQRRGIEQAVAAQVLVVIADKKLEFRTGFLRQPGSPIHARLFFYCWVDNGQDLR